MENPRLRTDVEPDDLSDHPEHPDHPELAFDEETGEYVISDDAYEDDGVTIREAYRTPASVYTHDETRRQPVGRGDRAARRARKALRARRQRKASKDWNRSQRTLPWAKGDA